MISPWAKEFLGIPYRNMGRTRKGADCWGLIVIFYEEYYGVSLPKYVTELYESTSRRQVIETIEKHRKDILTPTKAHSPGDIILVTRGELALHVALYVGKQEGHPHMLHTTHQRGHSFCERSTGRTFGHAKFDYYRVIQD